MCCVKLKYHRIGCIVIVLCHVLSFFWSGHSIVKSSFCDFILLHILLLSSKSLCLCPSKRELRDKSWDYGMVRSCMGNMTNMANVGNDWTPTTMSSVERAG